MSNSFLDLLFFLLSYCVVTTLVHLIYVKINPEAFKIEEGTWKQQLALIANAVALAFFTAGCYFAKKLYDILRLNYQPPDPGHETE
jgi:hypothetical protein